MTQIISRIYGSRERAAEAVKALKDYGFSGLDVHAVLARPASQDSAAAAPEIDDLVTSIQKSGVYRSKAEIYADSVRRGGSLVTVHAPFGSAAVATQILDRFDPIDSGVSEEEANSVAVWVDAAPLSSALQIPILLDDPAAFSSAIGLPTLLDSEPNKTKLLSSPAPLSSLVGLSVLQDKAAPLSSAVGLPLLSDDPAPFSSLFKIPLLTRS